MNLEHFSPQFQDWATKLGKLKLGNYLPVMTKVVMVTVASYLLASTFSAWFMTVLYDVGKPVMKPRSSQQAGQRGVSGLNLNVSTNYRTIETSIKERNIFNSAGEFPDEKQPDPNANISRSNSSFNMQDPCTKSTMNIELIGTIVMGASSMATIREQGYAEADVYKVGETIIGNDGANIVKIERNRVIINNNGNKECLELDEQQQPRVADDFPSFNPPGNMPPAVTTMEVPPQQQQGSGDCELEERFVQEQVGAGSANILDAARLVPNPESGGINGFKIFAIKPGSIFSKVGLQNGDIITQVNNTSLKQPDQGYALYQVFQEDREIRLSVLRNGSSPVNIFCRIK